MRLLGSQVYCSECPLYRSPVRIEPSLLIAIEHISTWQTQYKLLLLSTFLRKMSSTSLPQFAMASQRQAAFRPTRPSIGHLNSRKKLKENAPLRGFHLKRPSFSPTHYLQSPSCLLPISIGASSNEESNVQANSITIEIKVLLALFAQCHFNICTRSHCGDFCSVWFRDSLGYWKK